MLEANSAASRSGSRTRGSIGATTEGPSVHGHIQHCFQNLWLHWRHCLEAPPGSGRPTMAAQLELCLHMKERLPGICRPFRFFGVFFSTCTNVAGTWDLIALHIARKRWHAIRYESLDINACRVIDLAWVKWAVVSMSRAAAAMSKIFVNPSSVRVGTLTSLTAIAFHIFSRRMKPLSE